MMMLFEDSEMSALSELIAFGYRRDNMNCISFSEGDKNIIKKLTELRETNKILVVFIDVMPDNIKTVECYNKCIKWVDSEEVECYVIPIPCIEYYVIKAFYKESLVKNVVIDFMNYKDCIYDDNHRLLSNKSFEKFCKSVIKNYIKCFDDYTFYRFDCMCNSHYKNTKICKSIRRYEKAWNIIGQLPVFINNSNQDVITAKVADINKVITSAINLYYNIGNKYVEYGIIDYIPKLRRLDTK